MNLNDLLPKDKHDIEAIERLKALTDVEIEPLMPELLTWLQDANWPIFGSVAELLSERSQISEKHVLTVLRGTDEIWKYNILSYLLVKQEFRPLGGELLDEIKRVAAHPTEAEAIEEVSRAAKELIDFSEAKSGQKR